ncbi:MAG: cupin domain-containing protein [Nocardioidaceae bacterium]
MSTTTKRSFDEPDSTMDMIEKIRLDIADVGGVKLTRVTAQPGWVWSVHSRPVQKTDSCQVDHVFLMVSGRVAAKDDGGTQTDFAAGDLAHVPPGHDGWTIGDEPAVWIEVPH